MNNDKDTLVLNLPVILHDPTHGLLAQANGCPGLAGREMEYLFLWAIRDRHAWMELYSTTLLFCCAKLPFASGNLPDPH